MSAFLRKVLRLSTAVLLTATVALGQAERTDRQLQYILDRYLEVMGGSALLENLNSLYMTGNLILADGSAIPISILKKRPGKVRIIQYLPNFRLIQGYNGEEAWISRQYEETVHTRLLEGNGINVTVRWSKGTDVNAACGQLRSRSMGKDGASA